MLDNHILKHIPICNFYVIIYNMNLQGNRNIIFGEEKRDTR